MMSSPPDTTEGKRRAILQLSRLSNSPRSFASPSPPPSDSNPTQRLGTVISDFDFSNNDDVLMSTQHKLDDDTTNALPTRPRIRSTAKKYNSWQMPRPEPHIDTSMVAKEFGDFDGSASDEDNSIEVARGGHRSTPGKMTSPFNSLYDMTPPSGRSRKSYGDGGSLRRDAQIRRASRNGTELDTASPKPRPNQERRRSTLAQMHAKVSEDESSFAEERPPTVTFETKNTRFTGRGSRQTSLQLDVTADATARRAGTSRSAPLTAQNATAQSFMLPDLPNLTELVSGVFQDGTPVFSKATPSRTRLTAPSNPGRAGGRQPNHIPVDSVPIPPEEKAIFASLQLLREKVAHLETERAEAEKRIDEQEVEIIELKAANAAQENLRRSDSALGSTDGEGSGKGKGSWKVEKTRLEASVETLRTRLDRAERKLSVADIAQKRSASERENLLNQLSVAFQNLEEVKVEKEALSTENDTLRQEIDALRAENEALLNQLKQEQEQYEEETIQLRRQVGKKENAALRENDTLHAELARVRAMHDEDTQHLARKEAELRKARKDQAEYARLKIENDALRTQMATFKARRDEQARRWAARESELKSKVDHRDETIRHFQDMTQEQTNEAVRLDNEHLRNELAQMSAQHEHENDHWARKEARLRRKIEEREEAVRQVQDMTREVLFTRHMDGDEAVSGESQREATSKVQRRPSQRREDTRTRIANRVQQEVRNSRSVSSSHFDSHFESNSPQKSTAHKSRLQRASLPADLSRSVSAPVSQSKQVEIETDVESTTDLSLAPRNTPYVMRGGASGKPATAPVQPPPALDITELSFIDADVIAQLRRTLEEERAAAKKKAVAQVERQPREDTVRSVASARSNRQHTLPRKSSMKEVTERTTGTVFEDLTGHVSNHEGTAAVPDITQTTKQSIADASMLSNTSRRRRSVPVEMTSAFIIPDLTMQGTKKFDSSKSNIRDNTNQPQPHDDENCTVCRRNMDKTFSDALRVPKLVPVSQRTSDDPDATMRPVRSPKEALALVVKELNDEITHLHWELKATQAMLQLHDQSQGRRRRIDLENGIAELIKRISIKSDQVYNLYDVLEGQHADELNEQDVEDITRDLQLEEEMALGNAEKDGKKEQAKKKAEKKVTVLSYVDSETEELPEVGKGVSDGEEEEEELPWEGFEDTADLTQRFGGLDAVRRGSVY